MAGKPKPTALTLEDGNVSTRPIPWGEPMPVATAPDPPPMLKGEALAEWHRIVPTLERLGLLTELDRASLTAYCQTWSRWVECEAKVEELGVLVKRGGKTVTNPYLAQANRALREIHSFSSEFGMTPVSRTRISAKLIEMLTAQAEGKGNFREQIENMPREVRDRVRSVLARYT